MSGPRLCRLLLLGTRNWPRTWMSHAASAAPPARRAALGSAPSARQLLPADPRDGRAAALVPQGPAHERHAAVGAARPHPHHQHHRLVPARPRHLSTSARGAGRGKGGGKGKSPVQLTISDPAAILNGIAAKYESSTRLLMEYVDNSLDSAEELYRAALTTPSDELHDGVTTYPRPIHVHVGIDRRLKCIWVSDNCGGIEPAALARLVSHIGESRKRSVPWLNGQFGFGLHAFRAACKTLTVYSKRPGEPTHHLTIDRAKSEMLLPEPVADDATPDKVLARAIEIGLLGVNAPLPTATGGDASGTVTGMRGFDPVWYKTLSADSISGEIQKHFENLLRRPNLTVTVSERGGKADGDIVCSPFDYDAIEGTLIDRSFQLAEGGTTVRCKLVVSPKLVLGKRPRFFKHGRCINQVSEMRSFMDDSPHREGLWDHPSLSGFIEVGNTVDPVITRDEFTKTSARESLYAKLRPIEAELHAVLKKLITGQVDDSMVELETVLKQAVSKLARQDAEAFKPPKPALTAGAAGAAEAAEAGGADGGLGPGAEGPESITVDDVEYTGITPGTPDPDAAVVAAAAEVKEKSKPKGHYDIRFVSSEDTGEDGGIQKSQRSFVSGQTLYINISHPDFVDRMHKDSRGRYRFNSRVAAYLANELACYYRSKYYDKFNLQVPEQRAALYNELTDSVNSIESTLIKQIATLEKKLRRQNRWSPPAEKLER